MSVAVISLIVLTLVIILGTFGHVQLGLLSIFVAWLVGAYLLKLSTPQILSGFPTQTFLILVSVSYLFGIAHVNKTLDLLTQRMVRLTHGRRLFLPVLFFVFASVLSTVGAGNIGAVALLAPIAIRVAEKTRLSLLLMTLILICGANAGTFSPFAFTGVIANSLISRLHLALHPWLHVFLPVMTIQTLMASMIYLVYTTHFYLNGKHRDPQYIRSTIEHSAETFQDVQIWTLLGIVAFVVGVVVLKLEIGFMAMGVGVFLTTIGAADHRALLKTISWETILMVCGVSLLVEMVSQAQGMKILVDLISSASGASSASAILTFISGVLSIFASSSGVVMPTFIPLVPELMTRWPGTEAWVLVTSINVGSHIVDASPLSTLGALCLVGIANAEEKRRLFNQLLLFGFSMALVGPILIWLAPKLFIMTHNMR